MRYLVCGGRDFLDAERMHRILDVLWPSFVIHGCAKGADSLAANWAVKRGVPHKCYVADWHLHGKSAGVKRNLQMLLDGQPDIVLAFPGGRGTGDMVGQAMQRGVRVVELK